MRVYKGYRCVKVGGGEDEGLQPGQPEHQSE